jgi:hypothetical protein
MRPVAFPALPHYDGFDHAVINVRERMDEAVERFQHLGFYLTPRGFHTLGSINHLMVFDADYLELVGVPAASAPIRAEIASSPIGLNAWVLRTRDADALRVELLERGFEATPPLSFSRPVEIEGRKVEARFRTVRLERFESAGRVYFCEHGTPQYVWQSEWCDHRNGARGIAGAVVVVLDPKVRATAYARLLGDSAIEIHADGARIRCGDATLDLVTDAALTAQYGRCAPEAAGRASYMAVLRLRTSSLERTAAFLARKGIAMTRTDDALRIGATFAMNTTLEFVA